MISSSGGSQTGKDNRSMGRTKYTKEQLIEAAKTTTSMRALLTTIGANPNSGSAYSNMKRRLLSYGIDISHFLGKAHNRGKKLGKRRTKEEFENQILVLDSPIIVRTTRLRQWLIEYGYKDDICEECGQLPHHNGKKLNLTLHHINGNPKDNRLHNLLILCPNCHSQTENYSGRNSSLAA